MARNAKRILVITIGIIFVVFGFLGLVLPFLQGIIFLTIGIILLSLCFPKIRFGINKHTIRYPRLFRTVTKIQGWVMKLTGEI
ncbi:hypothetical protein HYZ82_02415 [Candidatus Nomurabacteria bacterium]|nr:hypothetical protein [Candidatus Nomurabacteria bacterium]